MPTRRTALIAASTIPLWAQNRKPEPEAKAMGHPVVHFEIGCKDIAATERFYGELFGWKMERNGPASTIDTGAAKGIPGHITSLGHEPEHYTMFYVEVDDVQAVLDKAHSLGGKTRSEEHTSELQSRFGI